MPQDPTIGRIVHYILDFDDCAVINRRRSDALGTMEAHRAARNGSQIHVGNSVSVGETFPAVVTKVLTKNNAVNLKVHLDGNDDYWATARQEGTTGATWHWPNINIAGRTDAEKEALRA